MKEILIFAGTTEGRQLSEYLAEAGIYHTLCVATEYGEIVLKKNPLVKVRRGRMEQKEMEHFILEGDYLAVVDATHPYATQATENIKKAAESAGAPYLRLRRGDLLGNVQEDGSFGNGQEAGSLGNEQRDDNFGNGQEDGSFGNGQEAGSLGNEQRDDSFEKGAGQVSFFDSNEACAEALENTEGNILLTTGSRELPWYCASDKIKGRLYVRILPSMESLSACMAQGICGKHIIAMQGPFSADMNEAVIRQYKISYLVTKESGKTGGFPEKLEAARRTGIRVFVVGRPKEEGGYSFSEICRELERLCKRKIRRENSFEITLAGVGMGSRDTLTREAQRAIEEADILLGAERLLSPYQAKLEKRPFYLGRQIIPYLKEMQEKDLFLNKRKVTVLFSGDSGFYSGCRELYCDLEQAVEEGKLRASLRVLPGISSVAALASRLGESYQDAAIYSMHGRDVPNLIRKIRRSPKTFLLMSGAEDVNRLGKLLLEAGMTECEVAAGYQLSYENEHVRRLSLKECCEVREEGLYTCMIKNPYVCSERLTHGLWDESFLREKIPMTKEEVREISICKLHLCREAVVYDIGGGTGSVSVEMAGLSDEIQVYAIEQKKEAVSLIEKNKRKFGLDNITVVEAKAPEELNALPRATHSFIGGSGGRLKEILAELYRINPRMRVVINAVSMETICEIKECLSEYKVRNEEMVQVQVSRAKKMGSHHLMQAENPVWICAFDFCE
ncbi:MAG: precorrin-6y C5,15-methyltransferase (decarboxylating) subunit CbiE [Clostridium sp.]|nr:precorrin-6y C5,15-methyltransferase (decarboxylating) subunit CbiE [Clostridium sp.]